MNPNVGDLAHHAVAVRVMKQWTNMTLSSEMVAIITDNSTIIVNVQKIDIEQAIAQKSGVKIFSKNPRTN